MGDDACSEEDLQLQRLMERNSMSEAKAKKRISAQMSLERKCEQAHFVVENSGTIQDTREQVFAYTNGLHLITLFMKILNDCV
jgi:dephospho-CoA kinase